MLENRLPRVAIKMVQESTLISKEVMNTPEAAVRIVCDFLKDRDREYFCIVNIRNDCRPVNMNVVSVGTINYAIIHPREVFKSAILSNAASIILFHNHPSGCLTPSEEDLKVTSRLQEAGSLLGIPVADHIIAGASGDYLSLKEQGIIQENEQRLGMAAEW